MSYRINTNINAMEALRNLGNTSDMLSGSIEKLSTGMRINSAADDPAGLIITEKYMATINGLTAALQNTQDSINYAKTAEGALNEVNQLLRTARGLAVAASNTGALTPAQAQADQAQLTSIAASITRISQQTQFGTKYLLNGASGVTGQITDASKVSAFNLTGVFNGVALATNTTAAITVTTAATQALVTLNKTFATAGTLVGAGTFSLNGVSFNSTTTDTVSSVLGKINQASSQTGVTATYTTGGGIVLNSLKYGSGSQINFADANGVLQAAPNSVSATGVDATATLTIGGTTVNFTAGQGGNDGLTLSDKDGNTIRLTTTGNSTAVVGATIGQVVVGTAQFQIGANVGQTTTLSLGNFAASQLGTSAVSGLNMSNLDLSNFTGAQNAISVIDAAIDQVTTARGAIGSFQSNILESNVRSLGIAKQNLTASASSIRDVDVATEMTNFTKENILQQSGMAILAQANSSPQAVLKLLG